MSETTEEYSVNSVIGEGSEFIGEFKLDGLLRIDGTFRGRLQTNGKVIIGKTGFVDTDVRARVVVAGGEIHGNIYATESVRLLSTCKVYGDVITPKLQIDEGVIFNGICTVNPN